MKYPDGNRIRLYACVAEVLKKRREEEGFTLRDLEEEIGVSHSTLAKIEEGTTACPLHVLVALAYVYDCTLDDLVPVIPDEAAA